jgi:ABC-type nitrate/sulfonate/bicarbonate transport system permease component
MIAIWELLRALGVLPPDTVPSTWNIVSTAASGLGGGALLTALGHTMAAWVLGMLVACVIGIPVGILIGLSDWAHAATREVIDFIRPIPSVALVPVALVFLGFALKMEVVLIVLGAVWPLVFNSRFGVQNSDPLLIESSRAVGLGPAAILFRVRLVDALPSILTGFRTSTAIALTLAVSAEALAVPAGLGNVIAQSATTGSTTDAYAAIVITGIVGVLLNVLTRVAQRNLSRWNYQALGEAS